MLLRSFINSTRISLNPGLFFAFDWNGYLNIRFQEIWIVIFIISLKFEGIRRSIDFRYTVAIIYKALRLLEVLEKKCFASLILLSSEYTRLF